MNGCQTKSICLRAMKFHLKQQYTILFQGNFISEVYLLQEKSYLTFYMAKTFGGHCKSTQIYITTKNNTNSTRIIHKVIYISTHGINPGRRVGLASWLLITLSGTHINYLFTCDLYRPVCKVFDAGKSITRAHPK